MNLWNWDTPDAYVQILPFTRFPTDERAAACRRSKVAKAIRLLGERYCLKRKPLERTKS